MIDPAVRPEPAEVAESLSAEPGPLRATDDATDLPTEAIQAVAPTEAMPAPEPSEGTGPPAGLPVRGVRKRTWLADPRRRTSLAVAGLALVLGVVLGLVLLSNRSDRPPTDEPTAATAGPTIPEDIRDALARLRETVEP